MLVDFQNQADVGPLEADLAIVGAGPAGLTVALQFLDSGKKVVVLEGGGLEFSEESQELYTGERSGPAMDPLNLGRLRYFGGSSGHWDGRSRPLDQADFESKAYVPHSGWPIGYADLAPYLAAAHEILDLGPVNYDATALWSGATPPPAFDPDKGETVLWRFSPPTRFNDKYRDRFARADTVTVYYNANATNLALNSSVNRVQAIEVRSYAGQRAQVTADQVVLALGGVETPRFLMNCRSQMASGIGNQHDVIGRYWMEHINATTGVILASESAPGLLEFSKRHVLDGVELSNGYAMNAALRQEREVLNHALVISDRFAWRFTAGFGALLAIKRDLARRKLTDLDDHVLALFSDLDNAARGTADRLGFEFDRKRYFLDCRMEHSPNPDSRITLIDRTDRFGMNQARVDWRLSEIEQRTLRIASRAFSEELGRLKLGRVRLRDWLRPENFGDWGDDLRGEHHHMGGTRMSDNPKTGVVDSTCKVHGIDNLYVAGSSVFPTSGFANPTLTIVQLALRLADHLKSRIGHVTN